MSAANLIPGPTSTELAMHIGHRRGGWTGLVAAGVGFLLPAAVIVLGLAWTYVEYGATPQIGAVFAGIAPVVVAIVAHATAVLGRTALTTLWTGLVAVGAVVGSLAGVPPVVVLLAGGVVGLVRVQAVDPGRFAAVAPGLGWLVPAVPVAASTLAVGLLELGGAFVRVGLLLFGSGYVLVALLERELVAPGVLSRRELLDAVAIGQVTPGPVITTATWIGYLLLGLPGAIVATLGIAIPAFAFATLSVPVIARLRRSRRARAALDGIAAAVVGTLAVAAATLGEEAIRDPLTAVLAAGGLAALLLTRINPAVLIGVGAVAGIVGAALAR